MNTEAVNTPVAVPDTMASTAAIDGDPETPEDASTAQSNSYRAMPTPVAAHNRLRKP